MDLRLKFLKINSAFLAVLIVTALFVVSTVFGIKNGAEAAKTKVVYNSVLVLRQGFDNFFSDQDRFPSDVELTDPKILLTYFTHLPDNVSKTQACEKIFVYKRLSFNSYELNFCLAQKVASFGKGWNIILVKK